MSFRSSFNKLPFIGGIGEALWGSPEQEEMQRQMARAQQQYREYRPQIMEARMNAFNNTSNAFSPVNNLIGQMYGQQYMPNMQQIVQNPFPEDMQRGMYADAFGNTQRNKFYDPKLEQDKQRAIKEAANKGGHPDDFKRRLENVSNSYDRKFRGA